MSDSDIILDDETLLALYAKFQRARRSLAEISPQARYDDFIARGRYQGSALPAPMVATHHILELANTINRFHYDVHSLEAWRNVFGTIIEAEQIQALFEFVFPLASYSLSAPYSIKQKFITSIYQISYHTNRFCDKNWKEVSFNKSVNFSDCQISAKNYSSWPLLSYALSSLNSAVFVALSKNYRNQFHHGFHVNIELGYLLTVKQELPGSTSYVIQNLPPLSLGHLVPLVAEQYNAALQSYVAYVALIKEQEKLWPA